jgi:hypothetical protein
MRIWASIEEVAKDSENIATHKDVEARQYQSILDANGDCSVVSGWKGKLSKRACLIAIERAKSSANAHRSTADNIREAIKMGVPIS